MGIDPSKWLTNAKNEGDADVGDTETIKITGDVDVPKLLDDVNSALQKIRSIGGASASSLPEQLTEQDKKQAQDAIKDLSVEIYTGKDDKILRRFVVAMTLEVPADSGSTESADIKLDLQLLDLNEGQDIQEPESTKPFCGAGPEAQRARPRRARRRRRLVRQRVGILRRRHRSGEPGEVLAVHPGGRRRQREDPQVRGPADAVAADAA